MLSHCDRCKMKTDVDFMSQDITDTEQHQCIRDSVTMCYKMAAVKVKLLTAVRDQRQRDGSM